MPHQRLWGGPRPRSATTRYGNHPALYRAGFAACRQTLSTSTRNGCSSTFAINKTSDCFLRVGCELDSWIMVGADRLGSKEDVRVFNLIVLAQFVWRPPNSTIRSGHSIRRCHHLRTPRWNRCRRNAPHELRQHDQVENPHILFGPEPVGANHDPGIEFAPDSLREGTGFEPPVPRLG